MNTLILNTVLSVVPGEQIQSLSTPPVDTGYPAYASNLKRSPRPSRVLGSFALFLPDFDLHLHCAWLRDERGRERVGMPKVKVETPDGKLHHKTLARWGTAQSEERFQRAALRALHQLIANTKADGRDLVQPRRRRVADLAASTAGPEPRALRVTTP